MADLEEALAAVEKQLPPSLVAVTRVLGAAKRFRDAISSHQVANEHLAALWRRLGLRERWRSFIGKAADAFAAAEAALAASRIADIEAEYQDFFKDLVRGGPNVQPALECIRMPQTVCDLRRPALSRPLLMLLVIPIASVSSL
jgi:hypothetical protein